MAGFNTVPASGGGGGILPNLTHAGSIHMVTYNRSWAKPGTAGYYAIYSANQESGYAYFVGTGTTTGVPLNRMASVSHDFTRIDVIAPSGDLISLYKVKVKSTTEFANPFTAYNGGIPSFSAPITSSGNFVLPNNALPLVNVLVNGGGGATADTDHSGAGGGGGGVVKLTAYQAVGTTGVVIGAGGAYRNQSHGGASYFGNVYALGGGDGGGHSMSPTVNSGQFANGGGAGGHSNNSTPGAGFTQTSTTGLGNTGTPIYHGGFSGGGSAGVDSQQSAGGGGGGSAAAGTAGNTSAAGNGGIGHTSDIITAGTQIMFGGGGRGGRANSNAPSHGSGYNTGYGYGAGGAGYQGSGKYAGANGIVVVRYYIP